MSRASQDMTQAGGFPRRRRRTFQLNPCCPDGAGPWVTKQEEQISHYLLLPKQRRVGQKRDNGQAASFVLWSVMGRACGPHV